jgi:hypothetical protein
VSEWASEGVSEAELGAIVAPEAGAARAEASSILVESSTGEWPTMGEAVGVESGSGLTCTAGKFAEVGSAEAAAGA